METLNVMKSLKTTVESIENLLKNNHTTSSVEPQPIENTVEFVLQSEVKITAYITNINNQRIEKGNSIEFDKKVHDTLNSFDTITGTFTAPRNGYFKFSAHEFKDDNNRIKALSGTIFGTKPETFLISNTGTTKELLKGDKVVISRSFTTFNSVCSMTQPCYLVILSQNGTDNSTAYKPHAGMMQNIFQSHC